MPTGIKNAVCKCLANLQQKGLIKSAADLTHTVLSENEDTRKILKESR